MPRHYKRGVGPSKRGRHKKKHSGETKAWERLQRMARNGHRVKKLLK